MTTGPRSTADAQRERILAHAVTVFAQAGYHATPVTAVATAAGVSPAYIFRLFPGKLALFVAAVEQCYQRVITTMIDAGTAAGDATPAGVLDAMGQAYADLIADRDLIRLQGHAQSACDVPEIRAAVQRGLRDLVTEATLVSGADARSVQQLIANGQLCHLIVQADLGAVDETWAHTISDGFRHPEPA
jgi:AcrR family transcriptional regulator